MNDPDYREAIYHFLYYTYCSVNVYQILTKYNTQSLVPGKKKKLKRDISAPQGFITSKKERIKSVHTAPLRSRME